MKENITLQNALHVPNLLDNNKSLIFNIFMKKCVLLGVLIERGIFQQVFLSDLLFFLKKLILRLFQKIAFDF